MKTFITTYRSFANPWQLFDKLVQRYNTPKEVPKEKALPIKLRVSGIESYICSSAVSSHVWLFAVVIKYWVENHFDDFEDQLTEKLFHFIDHTMPGVCFFSRGQPSTCTWYTACSLALFSHRTVRRPSPRSCAISSPIPSRSGTRSYRRSSTCLPQNSPRMGCFAFLGLVNSLILLGL
jgi:hypothetical protein